MKKVSLDVSSYYISWTQISFLNGLTGMANVIESTKACRYQMAPKSPVKLIIWSWKKEPIWKYLEIMIFNNTLWCPLREEFQFCSYGEI